MRVAVTGSTGHLGLFVVHSLLRQGHDVAAVTRCGSRIHRLKEVESRIAFIQADSDGAVSALATFAPDAMIHLAWSGVGADSRDSADQILENVPSTLRLFKLTAAAGARTWVGLGSQAEYGPASTSLIESMPLRPNTTYGVAKVAAAELTRALCAGAGMRYVWLRLVATYGPADDEMHLIPTLIRHLQKGESPALTLGTQYVDYLYAADAADAIVACAVDPRVEGAFNLGSGSPVRVRELVETVRDLVAPSVALRFGATSGVPADLRADVARLRAVTRWRPVTGLAEGLAATVAWYDRMEEGGTK